LKTVKISFNMAYGFILFTIIYLLCFIQIIIDKQNLFSGLIFLFYSGSIFYLSFYKKEKNDINSKLQAFFYIILTALFLIGTEGFFLANLGFFTKNVITFVIFFINIVLLVVRRKNISYILNKEIEIYFPFLFNNFNKQKVRDITCIIGTLAVFISGLYIIHLLPNRNYVSISLWVNSINDSKLNEINSSNLSYFTNSDILNLSIGFKNINDFKVDCLASIYINSSNYENKTISIDSNKVIYENFTIQFQSYGFYIIKIEVIQEEYNTDVKIQVFVTYREH